MRVLITGGAGYIGTETIPLLTQDEEIEEIVVFDNFSRRNYGLFTREALQNKDKVRIVEGDVLDSRLLRSEVKKVDSVIHLAAKVSTPYASSDPHSYDQVNHWGTAELIYAIESCDNVRNLIHLSTTSIYGFSEDEIDETVIPNPGISYGLSKLRGENHVQRLAKNEDIRVVILRSCNVFGYSPSMRFEAVINRFVFEAKYHRKIYLHGMGKQIRPFINISEISQTIKHTLLDDLPGGIYNVFNENVAIADIAAVLKELVAGLEMQQLNQHITYGSLRLKKNPVIDEIIKPYKMPVVERIKEFIDKFSF